MLSALRSGDYDMVVASRHLEGDDNSGLANRWRHLLSDGGIRLAQIFLAVRLTDPMSGFFLLPRPLFEGLARRLNGQGFKILLDLILSGRSPLRVLEVPTSFRERVAGERKMDPLVLVQFLGMLLDKLFDRLLRLWFISFTLVGGLGVVVHLLVFGILHVGTPLGFEGLQVVATLVSMMLNFGLNKPITSRDQRPKGPRL